MNRYLISAIAATLLISPLAVNAISLNAETNKVSQSRPALRISQRSPETQLAHGRRRGGYGGMQKFLEQLDLTTEQSQKIDAIQEQFQSDNETLFQEMRTNHQEMRSLLASDASDQQLRQQHQKIQDLRQQLGTNRFETMLQVREILTPEQRAQMAELMEQHRGRRGNSNFNN
ncbi:MAG: Spy/CpxP family protein refolding chaperone [Xenococcus sp. (in: cyanobacteria)]